LIHCYEEYTTLSKTDLTSVVKILSLYALKRVPTD